MINRFDRILYGKVLQDKSARACSQALKEIGEKYNLYISKLLTDRGGEWQAEFDNLLRNVSEFLKHNDPNNPNGLSHNFTLSCSPHMNGLMECVNRHKKAIQLFIIDNPLYTPKELENAVQEMISKYNNTFHSTLQCSPMEFHGKTIVAFGKLQEELKNPNSKKEYSKSYFVNSSFIN